MILSRHHSVCVFFAFRNQETVRVLDQKVSSGFHWHSFNQNSHHEETPLHHFHRLPLPDLVRRRGRLRRHQSPPRLLDSRQSRTRRPALARRCPQENHPHTHQPKLRS